MHSTQSFSPTWEISKSILVLLLWPPSPWPLSPGVLSSPSLCVPSLPWPFDSLAVVWRPFPLPVQRNESLKYIYSSLQLSLRGLKLKQINQIPYKYK